MVWPESDTAEKSLAYDFGRKGSLALVTEVQWYTNILSDNNDVNDYFNIIKLTHILQDNNNNNNNNCTCGIANPRPTWPNGQTTAPALCESTVILGAWNNNTMCSIICTLYLVGIPFRTRLAYTSYYNTTC